VRKSGTARVLAWLTTALLLAPLGAAPAAPQAQFADPESVESAPADPEIRLGDVLRAKLLGGLRQAGPAQVKRRRLVTRYFTAEPDRVISNPYLGLTFFTKVQDVPRLLSSAETDVFPAIDGRRPLDYFDVVHIKVGWEELEPTPGVYDFQPLYEQIRNLKLAGRTVFVTLVIVSDQIPVWDIRGTPCWHWATSSWNPCEFDAKSDFAINFKTQPYSQETSDTYLSEWSQSGTKLAAAYESTGNRVGYACQVARNCQNCRPSSDPVAFEYIDTRGVAVEATSGVCDLYYSGYCFESSAPCRLPPTNHPLYGTPAFQQRLGALLTALATYETEFEGDNAGFGIDLLQVGNMGTSGEWDQGRNAYPWSEHAFEDARNVFNDVMQIQIDSLGGAPMELVTALPFWTPAQLKTRLDSPDSSDEEIGRTYLDYSGIASALQQGVSIYYAAFQPAPPAFYVQDAMAQHHRTRLIAGEPGRDDPSQMVTRMLTSHSNVISLGTTNPAGWKELTCLGLESVPAGGLGAPYDHCTIGKDYGAEPWPALWRRAMLNLGYRLHMSKVVFPASVKSGARFSIEHSWKNFGVGHLVHGYGLQFVLEDDTGSIVWKRLADDFEPADLINERSFGSGSENPSEVSFTSSFRLDGNVAPGRWYELKVGIVEQGGITNGPDQGSIRLDMPLETEDGDLHYHLGDLWVAR
jgi:hypothetical protein